MDLCPLLLVQVSSFLSSSQNDSRDDPIESLGISFDSIKLVLKLSNRRINHDRFFKMPKKTVQCGKREIVADIECRSGCEKRSQVAGRCEAMTAANNNVINRSNAVRERVRDFQTESLVRLPRYMEIRRYLRNGVPNGDWVKRNFFNY